MELDIIHNGDCIEGMKRLPSESIDVVVSSPPYNVGTDYDSCDDRLPLAQYTQFTKSWLSEVYRTLKPTGRIALNIPYQVKMPKENCKVFMAAFFWQIMEGLGFKFKAIVDLVEAQPHRSKLTAWGSWLSPSAPYIYNAKECVLIAYKETWKRERGPPATTCSALTGKEFIELTSGQWRCNPATHRLTKANFGVDVPLKAIKILSFEGDIVLDPFMGSGTTALACLQLGCRYIGFEISKPYFDIALGRLGRSSRSNDHA